MTVTTLDKDSASQDSFWEESNLPPAEPELPPDDATHLINPPPNTCPTCGEVVVKEPGQRGRTPKYHPECRPAKGASRSNGPRTVRVASKEREAAEAVEASLERVDAGLRKAVALLSVVDPYDAFVLHVNSGEILSNLRPVLMRFPWLREQAGNASAGASLLSLGITLFTTVLPIFAHHNLIPVKKFVPLLLNMPFFMQRLQERMAANENGDPTEELLHRIRMEAEKKRQQEQRLRTAGETIHASPTG